MNKNDIVTVEITDIGVSGEGIGHVDGYTLFIKDAVIGDVVEAKVMKAKKNYGYARLMKVITPSEYRVEPKCALPEDAEAARFRKCLMIVSLCLKIRRSAEIWNELVALQKSRLKL